MNVDKKLLEILACPKCHGSLQDLDGGLACPACTVVYPVCDDIPVMLIEEAISKFDWDAGKRKKSIV